MPDSQNQPRKDDAVLGGKSPPPSEGVILGGIEGVKRRLSSPVIEARVAALSEALNYADAAQICNLNLPALEHFELWFGSEDYGGDC